MTNTFKSALSYALSIKLEDISFGDNVYAVEDFITKSIANGFAGWYEEARLQKQVDFVIQQCAVNPPAKVLDAACGHGKHADILNRAGYEVKGTDISERLISYLKGKYGKRITFEKRAFSELDYMANFDLVIVLGNSLSLIPRNEMPRAIQNLGNALKIGGILFLELDNREYFIKNDAGKKRWNYHGDRWLILSQHLYDPTQKLEKTLDIGIDLQSMSIDQFPLTKCLYNQNELFDLLSQVGMSPVKCFGDWDGVRVNDNSPSILVTARKEF